MTTNQSVVAYPEPGGLIGARGDDDVLRFPGVRYGNAERFARPTRPSAMTEGGDVVVVSVNYRLGVFGYLVHEGVSDGNLGLYHQMLALEWVRDNISAFGGDPDNITVFGQSAGGVSTLALLAIPRSQLIDRAGYPARLTRRSKHVHPQSRRDRGRDDRSRRRLRKPLPLTRSEPPHQQHRGARQDGAGL